MVSTAKKYENIINSKELTTNRLKAVIYARVSTDNDSQKDSCNNQIDLAKNYISKHPNIELVDTLVDEGISGKNAIDRPEFMNLINMITNKKINLVIVKTLSRLHRDEETFYVLRRLCLQNGVVVITTEDNCVIDYADNSVRLKLGFEAVIDAQYSARQSTYGKIVQKQRCINKQLSAKDICLGYDWNSITKNITINPDEAEIINRIFELYTIEQRTPAEISRILTNEGFTHRFSKKTLNSNTINRLIKNKKYIGLFYINTRTSQPGTGMDGKTKRIPLPEEEWVLVEREDLQIVDVELFYMAQKLMASKQTKYNHNDKEVMRQSFEGKHIFAHKVVCAECGRYYHFGFADRKETIPVYRIHNHKECDNTINRISKQALIDITISAINNAISMKTDAVMRVEKLLYENLNKDENDEELNKIEKRIKNLEKELTKLKRVLLDEDVLDNAELKKDFLCQIKEVQNEKQKLIDRQNELNDAINNADIEGKIEHLKQALSEFKGFKTLNRDRVLRNVKEIKLHKDGNVDIILVSGITFNSNVGKYVDTDVPYLTQ